MRRCCDFISFQDWKCFFEFSNADLQLKYRQIEMYYRWNAIECKLQNEMKIADFCRPNMDFRINVSLAKMEMLNVHEYIFSWNRE